MRLIKRPREAEVIGDRPAVAEIARFCLAERNCSRDIIEAPPSLAAGSWPQLCPRTQSRTKLVARLAWQDVTCDSFARFSR